MFRIVIAEDETIIRKGLVYTIDWAEMGCTVVGEACDGEEGLAKIIELRPDFVITDVCMPRMSGLEMVKAGREECFFSSIFLTGYSEFEYVKQALRLQAADYLLKPIDPEKLKAAVLTAAEQLRRHNLIDMLAEVPPDSLKNSILTIPDPQKLENHYVQRVLEAIRHRYRERISIAKLSQEMNVSERYLEQKFKEETSHSFVDFLNRYRVMRALELIQKGGYRIAEIAEMVGFTQYKQFHKAFARYIGMPPTSFMEKYSQNGGRMPE